MFALQSGCANHPIVTPAPDASQLGKVAVVAASGLPVIRFEGFAHGRGQGVARGAGTTFTGCTGSLGRGSCSGEGCGAVLVLAIALCGAASVVGGIAGGVHARDARAVGPDVATLTTAMDVATIQDSLRLAVADAATGSGNALSDIPPDAAQKAAQEQDYIPLAKYGVDTVLEVGLLSIGTEGGGIDPPLDLRMSARARLVRTSDNFQVFTADYSYFGGRKKLGEWAANDGERLKAALRAGYDELGKNIRANALKGEPTPR